MGVRQGCGLSRILVSIYINNLAKEIINSGIGVMVGKEKVAILMYADDIVLITESKKDLQRGMNIATNFGRKWRCRYNCKKTQVVVFGRGNKKKDEWKMSGNKIDQVESYKYLGIEMENRLTWKQFKTRLKNKAEKNMTVALAMGIKSGNLSAKAAIGIWKALVRPVLEYGAEVWGEGRWEDAEILQRKMGRRILGHRGKSTDESVLGDLGWWRMKA